MYLYYTGSHGRSNSSKHKKEGGDKLDDEGSDAIRLGDFMPGS